MIRDELIELVKENLDINEDETNESNKRKIRRNF